MLKADKKDTRTKSMTSGVFTANLKLVNCFTYFTNFPGVSVIGFETVNYLLGRANRT